MGKEDLLKQLMNQDDHILGFRLIEVPDGNLYFAGKNDVTSVRQSLKFAVVFKCH